MAQIAPNPLVPERVGRSFDRVMAPEITGNRGPLRHEEGIGTDTDVPSDFARGAFYDTAALPGTINDINRESVFKHPDETMRERAHLGSAAWVESPPVLSDFVQGAGAGQSMPSFERVMNPMNRIQARRASSVVLD